MKNSKNILFTLLIAIVIVEVNLASSGQFNEPKDSNGLLILKLNEIIADSSGAVTISGNPEIVESPYGKAVKFNGVNDAIYLGHNPLKGLNSFTVEVIMKPESGGAREQRFIHIGELRGDRLMMETRLPADSLWYYDGFVKSGEPKITLVDTTKLHRTDKWYNVTFCVDNGKLTSFVNGEKELEGVIEFTGINSGRMSIGVRLNNQYWFKGVIYEIRISPRILEKEEFIKTAP